MGSTPASTDDKPRLLFVNEPRAYRDVLASAVSLLRPDAEVIEVEPDGLDAEIARLAPELVVCGHVTAAVEAGPHRWVLLYPDGRTFALVGQGSQWRRVPEVSFDGLLEIVADTLGPGPDSPNRLG